MNDVKEALKDELFRELSNLEGMDEKTDEYVNTSKTITELSDQIRQIDTSGYELAIKDDELKSEKKHKWIQAGLAGLGIVASTACAVWGTLYTTKWEESNTPTKSLQRGWINKLIPKK